MTTNSTTPSASATPSTTASDGSKGNYVDLVADDNGNGALSQITIFWSPDQPDRIRHITSDSRLTDAHGQREGLQNVYSTNPNSADYNPANFNRCARLLANAGKPAPDEVFEHPRHLRHRDAVKAALSGVQQAGKIAGKGFITTNAEVCDKCLCYVSDLDGHLKAAHP